MLCKFWAVTTDFFFLCKMKFLMELVKIDQSSAHSLILVALLNILTIH